jgi:hypothetical protein
MSCRYQCVSRLENHYGVPNHIRSIKHVCLFIFWSSDYTHNPRLWRSHWTYMWTNGKLTHGAHDLESTSQMSLYVPCMSQKLKDYIWNQLGLGYTMKQIYNKHKAIWWARVNVGEPMIKDDFIRLQKHCLFGLEA